MEQAGCGLHAFGEALDLVKEISQTCNRSVTVRPRGGGKGNIALARKFLGVIYHTLKSDGVFEDFPNFVLAS